MNNRTDAPLPDAVLILGPTGSGKTPLGNLIEKRGLDGRGFFHFDFGNELRRVAARGLKTGFSETDVRFVKGVLEEGLLLDDRHFPLARKIFDAFRTHRDVGPADSIVLNGLPRHAGQARDMATLVKVRALVVLECDAETVHRRLTVDTGGDREGRRDDGRALVERKLRDYDRRTIPLVEHYRQRGCSVIKLAVGVASTPDDVFGNFAGLWTAREVDGRHVSTKPA